MSVALSLEETAGHSPVFHRVETFTASVKSAVMRTIFWRVSPSQVLMCTSILCIATYIIYIMMLMPHPDITRAVADVKTKGGWAKKQVGG